MLRLLESWSLPQPLTPHRLARLPSGMCCGVRTRWLSYFHKARSLSRYPNLPVRFAYSATRSQLNLPVALCIQCCMQSIQPACYALTYSAACTQPNLPVVHSIHCCMQSTHICLLSSLHMMLHAVNSHLCLVQCIQCCMQLANNCELLTVHKTACSQCLVVSSQLQSADEGRTSICSQDKNNSKVLHHALHSCHTKPHVVTE